MTTANRPTPAIVTQAAVRRLPRWALLLLCTAYVLPGLVGRQGWKVADMAALGYMTDLQSGVAGWWSPSVSGIPLSEPALLPYWLGAWAMQLAPFWSHVDVLARVPFALLAALAMTATWYGTYYLARSPQAQPVPFAFGGEAAPTDYARAMADGGLLALLACLGLAQLAHETTPALAQLAFSALLFYALAALPYRPVASMVCGLLGLSGLALSGAGSLAVVWGVGGVAILTLGRRHLRTAPLQTAALLVLGLASLGAGALALHLDLWRWKLEWPDPTTRFWSGFAQLLLWFTWPAWPLAIWAVWRWRQHWRVAPRSPHVLLPMWFVGVGVVSTLLMGGADRTLLLALPAMAMLAAFALPTLQRPVTALIDWFTLLFFSGCGLVIWVVWIAMQTGFPAQPAANVARLAPGFIPEFSWLALALALAATVVWGWLVHWRVGRHRAAIWKSLVLPAGGATLCWMLLMTLWMPLLNYTQSYAALLRPTLALMGNPVCIEAKGLDTATLAAFKVYTTTGIPPASSAAGCDWQLRDWDYTQADPASLPDSDDWNYVATVRHPADGNLAVNVYRRR